MPSRDLPVSAQGLPQRSEQVYSKGLGDEVVLYLADGSAVHVLNRTAFAVWNLCDGDHAPQAIEEAIRAQFAIPEGVDVAEDVRMTLKLFRDKGLLRQD